MEELKILVSQKLVVNFEVPCYVLLHEFAYCGGRVWLQIANGFADKRPAHVPWWEMNRVFLSPYDIEEEKQS